MPAVGDIRRHGKVVHERTVDFGQSRQQGQYGSPVMRVVLRLDERGPGAGQLGFGLSDV